MTNTKSGHYPTLKSIDILLNAFINGKKPKKRHLVPLESVEAAKLMDWARYHPICKNDLIAIPNGGHRNAREAKSLKRQGVKPGVSDYLLSYPLVTLQSVDNTLEPVRYRSGLWVELKRRDKKLSKPTKEQMLWIHRKRGQGYAAVVAYGADEAIQFIEQYLKGEL